MARSNKGRGWTERDRERAKKVVEQREKSAEARTLEQLTQLYALFNITDDEDDISTLLHAAKVQSESLRLSEREIAILKVRYSELERRFTEGRARELTAVNLAMAHTHYLAALQPLVGSNPHDVLTKSR